jgi:membrane protease subunit HflC
MSSRLQSVFVGALIVAILLFTSFFTVSETELAIRTQFGQIMTLGYLPGPHFKWPVVDKVVKFERRIVTQNYTGETFLTNENRALNVAFYIKWRVMDPGRYYQSTGGIEAAAGQRLADIVKDGIKNAVAQRTLEQIVSAERSAFTGDMFARASKTVDDLGIQLIDVRVQRIDLPDEVATRVYASMQQSFERLARQERGEGEKASLRIRAEADRKRTEILSTATQQSLSIRGEADFTAGEIYGKAYGRNPEFYAFYRSLQAYKNSLGKDGDVLVISPDSEFFKYFKNAGGAK